MDWIKVKCKVCNGTRKTGTGHYFKDYCEACSGTGSKLVSEQEARALLLQKQIEDAKL